MKIESITGRPYIAVSIIVILDRQVMVRNSVGESTTSFAKANRLAMVHDATKVLFIYLVTHGLLTKS